MSGLGEFFSVASALTWALAVILFRRSGETLPAFELNFVKNLIGLALLIPTVLIFTGLSFPDYPLSDWLIMLLSGFLGIAVADTWYLKALNLMGASRTGIVATLYSPFVILLAAVFLGESLQGWQYAGFMLVLCGILLVTWKQNRQEVSHEAIRAGSFYGAGAVLLMAIGVVMVKDILERDLFLWTVTIRLLGGLGGMFLYLLIRHQWRSLITHIRQPQPWLTIVIGSILATYVSMLMWLAGYKLTTASVASVLNESTSAFIVLFAWLILKEPLSIRKIVGLSLTLGGVLLVVLYKF